MCASGYSTVRVVWLLLPPLSHPRSPEFPAGVFTQTLLAIWALLITTTEDATKLLPLIFRMNVPNTSASVTVVGLIEVNTGTGRELPHSGLIAEQPGRAHAPATTSVSKTAL
jgi:hypothetical protein